MDEQYKHLMEQQNIPEEINNAFYEKLNSAEEPRRRSVRWNPLLAAACLALMIPITVFAAEYIFGTPKVKLGKLDWCDSPNGFSIRFEDLDTFPPEAFPEEVQSFTGYKFFAYESWEEAEEALGIDLLNNTFLTNAEPGDTYYGDVVAPCVTLYSSPLGQLHLVGTGATYHYDQLRLTLKATLLVEHPEVDEDTREVLFGEEAGWDEPASYEEYTTKAGIPTVILRITYSNSHSDVVLYSAFFAVNDISYKLTAWVTLDPEQPSPEQEASGKQILLDALDGFELR